jgi:hypothetical protein
MAKKQIDPEHAEWLVKHRGDNQVISAKLYKLLKTYPDQIDEFGFEVEMLVGVAFSLWRSAFLSDKTGYRSDTTDKAILFLSEMIESNAILFSTERSANDWAFNYFARNARDRLERLEDRWEDLDMGALTPPKKRAHQPKDRWEYLHDAFCAAVNHFEDLLIAAKKPKNSK